MKFQLLENNLDHSRVAEYSWNMPHFQIISQLPLKFNKAHVVSHELPQARLGSQTLY